ncbi:MAG: hypothetical protein R3E64_10595 [Halioglobus sp.]
MAKPNYAFEKRQKELAKKKKKEEKRQRKLAEDPAPSLDSSTNPSVAIDSDSSGKPR